MHWQLYRAIDWTHMHHEQTYDVLSDRKTPWSEKKRWTEYGNIPEIQPIPMDKEPTLPDVPKRSSGGGS